MNSKGLAYWRASAEQMKSIEDLEGAIACAANGIKYGANPWFYRELMQIYLYEYSWGNSADTKSRYYKQSYLGNYL